MNKFNRLIPLALFLVIVVPFSFFADFYTRGEGREALNVKSACEGELLWPKNYDGLRSSKPPMYYWISCPFYKLWVSEFSVRLPSVISAFLVLWVCLYHLGRVIGERPSIIAALLLSTSPAFISNAEIARLDMLHSGSLALAWISLIISNRYSLAVYSGLFLTISTLTKGPVALVLTALSFGIMFVFLKDRRLAWRAIVSMGVATALSALWYVVVYSNFGKSFIQVFWQENINRFFGDNVPHSKNAAEFIFLALLGLSPVSLCLLAVKLLLWYKTCSSTFSRKKISLAAIRESLNRFIADDRLIFKLAVACLAPIIFYSFSEGKRPAYALVSVIFASIIIGTWADKLKRVEKIQFFKIFDRFALICIFGLTTVSLISVVCVFLSEDQFIRSNLSFTVKALIFSLFVAVYYIWLRRFYLYNPFTSFLSSAVTISAVCIFLFNTVLGVSVSKILSHKNLASWIKNINKQNIPVYSYDYEYYATKFYLHEKIESFKPFKSPPMLVIMPEASLKKFAEKIWFGRRIPEVYATYPGRVDKIRNKTVVIKIE